MERIEEYENELEERAKKQNEPKERVVKAKKVREPRERRKNYWSLFVAVLALIIGAGGMYMLIYYDILPTRNTSTVINKSEKEVTVTDTGIADAVEKLYDAVVVVEVYVNNRAYSSGTGFVYKTNDGKAYILTNHHVISATGKTSVKVIFTDGDEIEAKVEGSDEYADLAVLSVDEKDIVAVAEIGKSEDLRLGDTVFTVGAPLDTEYYWSVTRGVVSGKNRLVEVSSNNNGVSDVVMNVLQTDASINSGNSGGPLANSNGEVVGITNMKLVSSGVEGIGFAIPIEDAISYANKIIAGEDTSRPQLGLNMLNLSDRYALLRYGINPDTELTAGVVVINAVSGGPAAQAKIKKGDIIIAMDDEAVKNVAELRFQLYKHEVGDTVELTVERDGKVQKIKVKLGAASDD